MTKKCLVPTCQRNIPPWREEAGRITCGKLCSNEWNHIPCKLREKIRGKKYGR